MPPSPGHGLGPQGARLTSSPTAGCEVDTCALRRGEAGAGKAASPQLCQRLAQALSPRLHPQTRLASRHLQRQPRARRAAAGKQGPAGPGTGVCRNVLGCSLPGREPGDQGQAKRPAPRSRGPLARHRPDAQMPGHREQRKEFQVSAGRLPGQAKAPPAPLALEHPASLRWPAAATERSQKPFTRQGHQHRGQTISNKSSLPRSLSPRGGVQTEVVGKI